jgi:hypothetical protein
VTGREPGALQQAVVDLLAAVDLPLQHGVLDALAIQGLGLALLLAQRTRVRLVSCSSAAS